MDEAIQQNFSAGSQATAIYYLDSPPSAGDLVVNYSGRANGIGVSLWALSNTRPGMGATNGSDGWSTTLITTAANSFVVASIANNGNGATAQGLMTPLFDAPVGSAGGGSGYQQVPVAGLVTPTFIGSTVRPIMVAAEFLATPNLPAWRCWLWEPCCCAQFGGGRSVVVECVRLICPHGLCRLQSRTTGLNLIRYNRMMVRIPAMAVAAAVQVCALAANYAQTPMASGEAIDAGIEVAMDVDTYTSQEETNDRIEISIGGTHRRHGKFQAVDPALCARWLGGWTHRRTGGRSCGG
jgi:hypothetical protein